MMTLLEPAMGAAVLPDVRSVHYVNGLLPSRQYQRPSPGVKTPGAPACLGVQRRAIPRLCHRRAVLVEQGADLLGGLHGFAADLVQSSARNARGRAPDVDHRD